MVTFSLPAELRGLARANQKLMYTLLFDCTISTLRKCGLNDKTLAAKLAATGILHTHTRRLDYHPHVHLVVPSGGVNTWRKEWRKLKGKYLFNGCQLVSVFRGKMPKVIAEAGLTYPKTPEKWVVQCKRAGQGLTALQYLSRYLYRGVISIRNIVEDDGDFVTFQYKDSTTKQTKKRKMKGEDFVALVLQYTLPKGFRRARNYGFYMAMPSGY